MSRFIPELDIVYLVATHDYSYCVIKKPEPIPGEKELMVREGCTVLVDGTWWYWRSKKPIPYIKWKKELHWDDRFTGTPDVVVSSRLNKGQPGIPAPRFVARYDNNWLDNDPIVVPDYVTAEMLGDLAVAHLQLSDEIQEGKPLQKQA